MIPAHLLGRRSGDAPGVIHNVSRREFLVQLGLAGSGLVLGLNACGDDDAAAAKRGKRDAGPDAGGSARSDAGPVKAATYTDLDTFVSVGDDGSVRVTVHRSEMGQGVRTSLATLVADEIGAKWSDVRVTQADGDMRYGDQNTDSSASLRTSWDPLRKAGASAREMLIAAAAKQLGVNASELSAKDSAVVHAASSRKLTFGELAVAASKLDVPASPTLRDATERTIIGRATTGIDATDVVRGKAVYGMDVEVPGMLHASLERSPTLGGKITSYDSMAARAVPGVRDVIEIAGDGQNTNAAIAVIGDTTWAAINGRSKLAATWDTGDAKLEQTKDHRAMLADTAMKDGKVALDVGDFDAAVKGAARVIEAQYTGPYLAHSPMEPLVAVADVRDGKAEIWAPTQDPIRAQSAVASLLGITTPGAVTVHVTLLGGGFGRKSQPDFVIEAAAVSKAAGKPIKLTWTREDEVRHGYYRPENRQRLRATLDADNKITGLAGHSVFSTIIKALAISALDPLPTELAMGWSNVPFDLPNVRMSSTGVDSDLRIGWWRSVCNTFHGFALSSFVDELAAEIKQDPIELYKTLLGKGRQIDAGTNTYDTGRMAAVVDKVKSTGLWGKSVPAGEGIGFAAHMSFDSYAACVMHVAVASDKTITIKQVDYAVDCGTVVNPDGVQAQCEGGLVYGLSAALYGEITVKDGAVEQGNFDTYPVLRIDKMPQVNVAIVESDAAPSGIGEPPTPVAAPALLNAIFAATGVRVRDLPLSAQGYS